MSKPKLRDDPAVREVYADGGVQIITNPASAIVRIVFLANRCDLETGQDAELMPVARVILSRDGARSFAELLSRELAKMDQAPAAANEESAR